MRELLSHHSGPVRGCLTKSSPAASSSMLGDHRQEGWAVAVELGFADTGHVAISARDAGRAAASSISVLSWKIT